MTKKQIQTLADKLAKIPTELTGDNKTDWENISNEVKKHPELVKALGQTNVKELRDKGFIAFAITYHLITQSF